MTTVQPAISSHQVREKQGHAIKAAPIILLNIVVFIAGIIEIFQGVTEALTPNPIDIAIGSFLLLIAIFLLPGYFTLQPNEARVLILFGTYKGSIKKGGFYWANPFYSKNLAGDPTAATIINATNSKKDDTTSSKTVSSTISLRQRTQTSPILKVNDKSGNPIEIADVMVWQVSDTAKALFDVDDYKNYVSTQSETALRHVASLYAYDNNESSTTNEQITLRSNIEEVSQALKEELSDRLAPAGITVNDARLTHLAYSSEIAQVMLRRQQAEAVIAARTKIVQGAVSMVDMAIKELDKEDVINLDDERKATMVSNLMVVLCADNDAQPVINAGSLYN